MILHPKSKDEWLELRTHDITSTESPALFDCSPYMTKFELWNRKKNKEITILEPNKRMKWGTRLESAIASGVAEDQGWKVRPMKEYIRDPDTRTGSSFDYWIEGEESILEVKNVDGLAFRDGWIVEGDDIQAPTQIELQVQHQMYVASVDKAYIAALVGGNRVYLLERRFDESIITVLKDKIAEFWASIEANNPPEPVMPDDAAAVIAMNQMTQAGLAVQSNEVIDSLAMEYVQLGAQEKEIKGMRETLKAKMLESIGAAERCLGPGYTISAKTVAGKHIEYDRAPFRSFRVNIKREKSK